MTTPHATAVSDPAGKRQNILAVASGKGGVGKTWLAVTLAHLFARSGRSVLLFDGDIGLANVDVQLGLMPEKDLNSVFFGTSTLKDVITKFAPGGFDIIAGRSGTPGLSALSPTRLKAIREELYALAGEYDIVMIDLGAGVEDYIKYLSSIAARCLVVVTDEPTSMTDAYAFIKLCGTGPEAPQIQIVVNQAATQKEGDQTYAALSKACATFLKMTPPKAGVIRRDNKVKDAIRHQESLVTRAPYTLAATDAAAISIKLLQKD